ncbi:MAG TPA: 4Fe-4S single cluster domain-containing protein [Abditibacterium sp.]|jgi:anaerobic ribonucleoside-triphosphate reductase activating protein
MKNLLDVADWAFPAEGLGPGKRLILWVRGCPLACPGCMTPEFWDNGAPQTHRETGEIAAILAPLLRDLDGLTISGGEPTLQSAALTDLIEKLRQFEGLETLEVLSYSGFTLEELNTRGADVAAYLCTLDILIDGRFEQNAGNLKAWRGSDNQRVHLLSERAQRLYADKIDAEMPAERPLQLQMLGGAGYRLIGIPKRGDLAAYRAAMNTIGIKVRPDVTKS